MTHISRLREEYDSWSRQVGRGARVICYHSIVKQYVHRGVQWAVTLELPAFEEQMKHLAEHYDVVSLREIEAIVLGEQSVGSSRPVAITFDDGYRTVREVAGPLLASLNMPFSVFVNTAFIGADRRLPTFVARVAAWHSRKPVFSVPMLDINLALGTNAERDAASIQASEQLKRCDGVRLGAAVREMRSHLDDGEWADLIARYDSDAIMSWDDARAVTLLGGAIEAHGHRHVILSSCGDTNELREEVARCVDSLRVHGHAPRYFGYPNGKRYDFNADAERVVGECGCRLAFTTLSGLAKTGTNPMRVPRMNGQQDSIDAFRWELTAGYARRFGRRLRGYLHDH